LISKEASGCLKHYLFNTPTENRQFSKLGGQIWCRSEKNGKKLRNSAIPPFQPPPRRQYLSEAVEWCQYTKPPLRRFIQDHMDLIPPSHSHTVTQAIDELLFTRFWQFRRKKKFHSNVRQNLKFDSIWNPRIAQSKLSWYLSKMTASAKFGVLICSKSCFEISVYYCPIDLTWDAPDATFLPPVYDRRKTAVKSTILIRVSLSSQVLRNISWEFQPNRPAGWLFFLIPTFIRMLKTKIKPDVKAHSAEMSTLLVQQFPPDKQVF